MRLTNDHTFNCPQCRKVRNPDASDLVEPPKTELVRLHVTDRAKIIINAHDISCLVPCMVEQTNIPNYKCAVGYEFSGPHTGSEPHAFELAKHQKISELFVTLGASVEIHSSQMFHDDLEILGFGDGAVKICDLRGVNSLKFGMSGTSEIYVPKQDAANVAVNTVHGRAEEGGTVSGVMALKSLDVENHGIGYVALRKSPECAHRTQGQVILHDC